ncbi:MAG TPA: hypothetical protein VEY50_01555 [Lysobacter sp.]|nr:hypothetical protein [Lysobacter sp.]
MTRSMLALAISALLAAPVAFAQNTSDTLGSKAQRGTTATDKAQGTAQSAAQQTSGQQGTATSQDASVSENSALENDRAQSTHGAEQAATHSMAAMRGVWATLDTDGDGRISRTEGGVDADFKANFEMMDADKDGFVTDTEYRSGARSDERKDK